MGGSLSAKNLELESKHVEHGWFISTLLLQLQGGFAHVQV